MHARPVDRTSNAARKAQKVLNTNPAGMNKNAPVAKIANPTKMLRW